ncbi:MAG: hypothetical protein RJA36_1607 [Pseudomonadota bacterium]|jgi:hypothetical protein
MAQVPTGTTFHIASAYGSNLPFTTASNATECVLGMASTTGLANGDIVEVTSGWGRLNLRLVRLKSVVLNTSVTLEGIDTSSTTFFPAGSGAGTVRKVSTFTQLQQVLGIQSSGGDPKNVNYKYYESDVEFQINDGFSATTMTLELDADSIGTAGYTAAKSLTDTQSNTGLRINTRNGAVIYQPCTVALNEAVQFQDGQVNRVRLAINSNNRLVRYAS